MKNFTILTICLISIQFSFAQRVPVNPHVAKLIEAQKRQPTVSRDVPHRDNEGGKPYRLLSLHSDYKDSDEDGYTYLSPAKRSALKIQVDGGKIYDSKGYEIDSSFKTNGGVPYVMDKNGTIYISKKWEVWKFEHHSIVAGEPVVCAGRMIIKNGRLKGIDDFSPNYRSGNYYGLNRVVEKLESKGISMSDVRVRYRSDTLNRR